MTLQLILSVLTLVLFVWALVDILSSPRDGMGKLIWIVVVLVLPLLGPILYYFIGRKHVPSATAV
jgi:phospholipase D-like protein